MTNPKHQLAQTSEKFNSTNNYPFPPAESKNVNDNAPSTSLGRELPPLTFPIANRATNCSANSLRIYCHNISSSQRRRGNRVDYKTHGGKI